MYVIGMIYLLVGSRHTKCVCVAGDTWDPALECVSSMDIHSGGPGSSFERVPIVVLSASAGYMANDETPEMAAHSHHNSTLWLSTYPTNTNIDIDLDLDLDNIESTIDTINNTDNDEYHYENFNWSHILNIARCAWDMIPVLFL